MFSSVKQSDRVLLLWSDLGSAPEQLQAAVEQIQATVGPVTNTTKVCVENIERVSMSNYQASSFDKVYSGCLGLATISHDLDLLALLAKLLKPGGQVTMVQAVVGGTAPDSFKSTLILSGLTPTSSPTLVSSYSWYDETVAKLGPVELYTYTALKPQHEVGAARLLSFAKPVAVSSTAPSNASVGGNLNVWTLEDMDDDTVELVDDQSLLAEEDLIKPDPASLRVCGTTGKRKACKDCSCGLSEELSAGKEPTTKSVTSSCGSCYLGDAFRCGSCPYLGMPAFKPGEKITLSDRQLNPDLREVA